MKKANFCGKEIEVKSLAHDVVTCDDSARAKGTHASDEMKSLLCIASSENEEKFYVVHVPGDKNVNWKAVRKFIGCRDVRIAPASALELFNTKHGTVSPISSSKLSALPQLVSYDILEKDHVGSTTDELHEYVTLRPYDFLSLDSLDNGGLLGMGDFSKDK